MVDSKAALKEMGLSENEASTYIALLRLGSAIPSELSQKTNIHRINLYDILNRLQEKGVVSYSIVGKRKTYEAIEPKRLLDLMEEKKKHLEEVIPSLNTQMSISQLPQEAVILKDRTGIKNVFIEMTKSKTEICIFASGWGFRQNFPDYYDVWHQRLRENKKVIRSVISSKFLGQDKVDSDLYNMRYLPSQFVFPSTTALFNNKVLMVMWSKQPIAILIRGKEVYESYKQYFNLLWDSSKSRAQIEKNKTGSK